jgi:hypothetical protein
MTSRAKHDEVGQFGRATVYPVLDVVAFAPGGWGVAAHAASVPDRERTTLRQRDHPGAPADVEDL